MIARSKKTRRAGNLRRCKPPGWPWPTPCLRGALSRPAQHSLTASWRAWLLVAVLVTLAVTLLLSIDWWTIES